MTNASYTSHPRVTIGHSPSGPVVVHSRRTGASAAFGRVVVVVAFAITLLYFGAALYDEWRAAGEIALPGPGVMALAVIIPLAGIAYALVAARNRVEVAVAGEWVQIRPRPFNFGRGQDVRRAEIDRVQVEESSGYRVQFVDGEGFGLLPRNGSLSGIATQDEATAVAGLVARLSGLRFVPGVQPRATPSPALGEDVVVPLDEKAEPTLLRPVDPLPDVVNGTIRTRQSKTGEVMTYTRCAKCRWVFVAFAVAWLAFCALFTYSFVSGEMAFEDPVDVLVTLGGIVVFWLTGLLLLGLALSHNEFQLDGDALTYRTRLGFIGILGGRIPLTALERVGIDVYWDSYDKMCHRVVAVVVGPKFIDRFTMVDDVSEADGHALCMALHKHLGVPI